MDNEQQKILLSNSIERIIKTTISLLKSGEIYNKLGEMTDEADINLRDWEEVQDIVRRIWAHEQEEVRKDRWDKQRSE